MLGDLSMTVTVLRWANFISQVILTDTQVSIEALQMDADRHRYACFSLLFKIASSLVGVIYAKSLLIQDVLWYSESIN